MRRKRKPQTNKKLSLIYKPFKRITIIQYITINSSYSIYIQLYFLSILNVLQYKYI